jgi:hypothetical protein
MFGQIFAPRKRRQLKVGASNTADQEFETLGGGNYRWART